jgi:hypothetical protein
MFAGADAPHVPLRLLELLLVISFSMTGSVNCDYAVDVPKDVCSPIRLFPSTQGDPATETPHTECAVMMILKADPGNARPWKGSNRAPCSAPTPDTLTSDHVVAAAADLLEIITCSWWNIERERSHPKPARTCDSLSVVSDPRQTQFHYRQQNRIMERQCLNVPQKLQMTHLRHC